MDYPVEQLIELDETKWFLRAARRYCSFIELTAKTDAEFLEELELVLLELYKQATTLRSPTLQHNVNFVDRRSDDESARILHEIAKKLGAARHYWEVFDPLDHEDTDSVCGDLLDDLADIYRDLKTGLMIFERGTMASREDALWQLKFGFDSHWGRHAIGALKAVFFFRGRS